MSRYKVPKFKKGDLINTPDGEATVDSVHYFDGKHWYSTSIGKGFYREDECKLVQKKKGA